MRYSAFIVLLYEINLWIESEISYNESHDKAMVPFHIGQTLTHSASRVGLI
jgi:hypothetical protein